MLDLHNHILPNLDDGPESWSESLEMARLAIADGIQGVVCTPHWVAGCYENSRQKILETVAVFSRKLVEHQIPLDVYPGCELHVDVDLLQKVKRGEVLTLNDTGRYVLLEFPYDTLPENAEVLLWDFLSHHIIPVIAHPERNRQLLRDTAKIRHWIKMGVLVQITAGSVLGRFGKRVQRFCFDLLDDRMIHVVATDSHGLRTRTPALSAAYELILQRTDRMTVERLMLKNPLKIVNAETVESFEPPSAETRKRPVFWRKWFFFCRSSS